MANKKLRFMVYLALFVALIALSTAFIKVPSIHGYANLGDGFIIGAAIVFGPWAVIPAALGSMLADVILGYVTYAPATLVIKGLMGLVAGLAPQSGKKAFTLPRVLLFAAAELIMVLGYFLFETWLFGLGAALASVVSNVAQGVVGLGLGLALVPLLGKMKMTRLHLER